MTECWINTSTDKVPSGNDLQCHDYDTIIIQTKSCQVCSKNIE
jgi:hypothetical protein